MKKNILSLLIASTLLLSGCKGDEPLTIEFNEFTPTAYVGEEYDFTDVLDIKKGIKYNIEVFSCDYITMTQKVLEVRDNFYFTPSEAYDLSVVVTAIKRNQKDTKTKLIPVQIKGDPIDELLVTGGFSGFADNGINKELVTDERYIKGENSKSAIFTSFQSSNPYTWGASILSLNNFRLLEYWSDKEWDNAVVHFWVYNPNEKALEFQLRISDDYTKMVDVDWGNSLNINRVASPGQWTEILFSLRRYGVNHTLYENEDGTRHDSLNVKIRYKGAPTSGESYSYQLYLDDIDIIPYSLEKFPDLDSKCYAKNETLEYGWENMYLDQGWTSCNVFYDRDFVNSKEEQESKSSLYVTFKGATAEQANGYAVIFSPEEEFKEVEDFPSLRHGLLELDIHFSSNISNTEIMVFGVQDDWTSTARYYMYPEATSNDWKHLTIDFATYPFFDSISSCIRLGFGFLGINSLNKGTAVVHIDNIKFNQNGGTPEKPQPETIANGWENMPLDSGWTGANVGFDYAIYNSSVQHESTSSMYLDFYRCGIDSNNGYAVIFNLESTFTSETLPNLSGGVLEFDVHFSNDITNHTVKIIGTHSDWNTGRMDIDPVETIGEWQHYSIDFSLVPAFASVSSCIRIGIGFNGVTESNKNNAVIHLDNVFYTV